MKYLKLLTILLLLPVLTYADFDTSLKYGSKGDKVVELQEFLIDKGFLNSEPTGNFYSLTLKAVKAFQTSYNLPSTGFFGPMSRAKANELLAVDADNAELNEVGSITPPVDTTVNKQLEDLNKKIDAQNAIIQEQKQTQSQTNVILEQIKNNTNKVMSEPTPPSTPSTPSQPTQPTPPPVQPQPVVPEITFETLPKKESHEPVYFTLKGSDVFIKTLKVKISNIVKTEDSDFGISEMNLRVNPVNPLYPNDRSRRTQYTYSSVAKTRPWTDTQFSIDVNRLITTSDILRIDFGGGSNTGSVSKLEFQIVGAESVATLPNSETKVTIPDLNIVYLDNGNN